MSLTQDHGDPEDVFSDALQSLYGYAPIAHSSAGSVYRYTLTEEHLRLQSLAKPSREREASSGASSNVITLVTPTTESKNWFLHASSIWASSLFLADHLEDLHLDQHIQTVRRRGQTSLRVLELGAGAGLPSIVIAKCFDSAEVVASDYPDDELIRTLEANVERNGVSCRCRVVPYVWGSDASVFRRRRLTSPEDAQDMHMMDVIVAADIAWNPESHALFLESLRMLLRRTSDSRIYLILALHTGRYTIQAFINLIEGFGLDLEEIFERNTSGCCQRGWSVEREEEEQDRRQWIVWMKIRWREDV